jgi:group I intron endonuclease
MTFNNPNNKKNSIKNKENLFDSSLKSGLYVITCIPLQKHYLGQSSYITRRLNAHKSALNRGIHENAEMQKDYNKYGENAFIFQKLYFGHAFPKETRENFETLILSTLPKENRYNVFQDWRKRDSISNPFYGKQHSQKTKDTLSSAKKGQPSPFKGQQQSDLVKQKISEENKGKSNLKKAVYINSVYYESVTEAAEKMSISRRLIRERCHSKEERFNNYQWADSENITEKGLS